MSFRYFNRLILFLLIGVIYGIPSKNMHAQPAGANDQEAIIRELEDQERMAVLTGDITSLEKLWAVTMIVNNPQNRITPNRDAILKLIRDGILRYASFERSIETITFVGDLAIVMGSETVEPAGNASTVGEKVHRRFTNIWRMKDGRWQVIARHANVIS